MLFNFCMLEKIVKAKLAGLILTLCSACSHIEVRPNSFTETRTTHKSYTESSTVYKGEIIYQNDVPYLKIEGYDVIFENNITYNQTWKITEEQEYKVSAPTLAYIGLPWAGLFFGSCTIGIGITYAAGAEDVGKGICLGSIASLPLLGLVAKALADEQEKATYLRTKDKKEELVEETPVNKTKNIISKKPVDKVVKIESEDLGINSVVKITNGVAHLKLEPGQYAVDMKKLKQQVQQVAPGCDVYKMYEKFPSQNIDVYLTLAEQKTKAQKITVKARMLPETEQLEKIFQEICGQFM
jgi:hypothetical protein